MAAKTCPICSTRKMYTGAGEKAPRLSEMCNPCYIEAGWENTHSDNGHDVDADGNPTGEYTEGCWICHPELNLAAKPASERAGTSRSGMRLTVPIRAAAKAKAEAVKAQLPEGYAVTIRTVKGITTLKLSLIHI